MKKILIFTLIVSMLITIVLPFASFADGEVIEIDSAADLAAIGDNLSGNYKLTADIEATAGIAGTFTGTFDGDGHKITGLTTALFEIVSNATVKNVTVSATIAGESTEDITRVAIVAAKAELACTFENVTAEGSITYNCNNKATHLGAIIGESWSNSAGVEENSTVNIIGCTNKADITLTNPNKFAVGGILGYASGFGIVNVTRCVYEGDITATGGDASIAGIVGRFNESKTNGDIILGYFTECANLGDIIVTDATGSAAAGIVCAFAGGSFSKCYNVGDIQHNKESVGIVQWWNGQKATYAPCLIEYCYNASPNALTYEFYDTIKQITWAECFVKGNCYLTGRTTIKDGAADKVDANDPNVECADIEEIFEALSDNGYVMPEGYDYPVLPFQVVVVEDDDDDIVGGGDQDDDDDTQTTEILTVNKTEFAVGEAINVTAIGSGTDWVGIYIPGEEHSLYWAYVTTAGSGVEFDITKGEANDNVPAQIPAGKYIIRLMPNDSTDISQALAEIEVTIEPNEPNEPNRPTGDATAALLVVSAVALLGTGITVLNKRVSVR